MRAFRILSRNIRDAFKSIFRNFSLSFASITCTTITLILLAVTLIVSYNVNSFTKDLEKELVVVLFVEKNATKDEIDILESKLNGFDNISEIKYISNQEEIERMKGENKTLDSIMSTFDENTNPLLNRFDIKTLDAEKIPQTVTQLEKLDTVHSVNYAKSVTDKVLPTFNIIEKATVVIVIALILVTAFLISNTIKITIFARKNEIEIMRLVGTRNLVIRLPFLFEGFIIGLIGSLIPIGVSIYGYYLVYEHFDGYIFSNLIKLTEAFPFVIYISLILLAIGCLVGMFGSYRAVRRYLKI